MLNRKVHKAAVLCMDCSAAKSLTTGSFDKQLRLFDTRGMYVYVLMNNMIVYIRTIIFTAQW